MRESLLSSYKFLSLYSTSTTGYVAATTTRIFTFPDEINLFAKRFLIRTEHRYFWVDTVNLSSHVTLTYNSEFYWSMLRSEWLMSSTCQLVSIRNSKTPYRSPRYVDLHSYKSHISDPGISRSWLVKCKPQTTVCTGYHDDWYHLHDNADSAFWSDRLLCANLGKYSMLWKSFFLWELRKILRSWIPCLYCIFVFTFPFHVPDT